MANSKIKSNSRGKAPQTNSKKRSANPPRDMQQELVERHNAEVNRIIGIAIFALSVLFFFVAVISGDGLWKMLHNFYIGLFGWFASVLFPIICLVYSALYTVKKQKKNMTFEVVSIIIVVLFLSAFIHIVENTTGLDFATSVKDSYTSAPTKFNGGLFGAIIGWALLTFGKAPAIIVDLIIIFVVVMLFSKLTINQLFKTTAKPVKKAVEKAPQFMEERREKRKNRNIDIYLDDEPPTQQTLDDENDNKTSKKRKSKKQNNDNPVDELGDDETAKLIRDINATTAANRAKRENKPAPKSIDEIVKVASQDKVEPEKKGDELVEQFEVTKEDMEATVNDYKIPSVSLLIPAKHKSAKDVSNELKTNADLLISTLDSFGVSAEITDISRGPTVTRYELKPAAGVRISKITNLSDDIALNLAATHVRIEAPIPGKAAVGIEVPNNVKNTVSMRELIDTADFSAQKSLLSAGIGKDIAGNCVYCDIAKMPHLLIAGTTGSGKSVCMNSIIVSILYRAKPDEVKLLMIDPKKVEFSKYENIPHLLVPVVTDPRKASGALGWAVSEMLERYQKFSDTGVRDIEGYNKYVKKHDDLNPMPKVVICIDELADLMMAAPKEVEDSICRLAQMARAAGMHLVIATQRPSVDVITGLIKANISSRIALTVSSQIDSRTILDTGGAEKLLGRGDMLYSPIGSSKPLRVQGCYISDEEVEAICDFVKTQGQSNYDANVIKEIDAKAAQDPKASSPFIDGDEQGEQLDSLFGKAVEVVLENGRASTSFLQRKLSVGYSRGSKIMDQLEEKGIIGPQEGSKPREIKINMQQWLQMQAYDRVDGDFTADNTEQMSFESDSDDEVVDNQDDGVYDNMNDEDF